MNVEIFSEWLRRQGHRIVETESSRWFDRGPRVFMAFPWHRLIRPSAQEVRDLLRSENAAAARYSAPPDDERGAPGYDVVLESASYDMGQVSQSTRPRIRKAIGRCEIVPIAFERYAREGWVLEADTRERQGRSSRGGQRAWELLARAAEGLEGFEAWGAIVDGRLAASLMFTQIDDCATLLYQQSHRDFFGMYVNNAFTFVVTRMLAQRPGVRMIHYGLQGLDAKPTVDEFKFHLGYSKRPVHRRVVFHPLVAPLVNRATHAVLRRAQATWKDSALLSKTEGLVRVCLAGRQPQGSTMSAVEGSHP